MHKLFLFLILVNGIVLNAQEFNATVAVNAEQTGNPNLQVFKTMERAVTEFVNNTKWTDVDYRTEERIDCSFFITINGFTNDSFTATLQVQASRPTYGSNYKTSILNINDKQFNFNYLEFQPLNYNPNNFESNLISVIAFYLYTILGIDADTFELNSGTAYFQEAKNIVGNAQGSNSLGWNAQDGTQTRFRLNDDLLSGTYDGYRSAMYTYHREGLDAMSSDLKKGKTSILESLNVLSEVHRVRPNSYIMRVFFDAKADEVTTILSGGPSLNIVDTMAILSRIAPTYSKNWAEIKF
ncbi:type IX secretion system protein PorD [Aquimarina sp. 2201CG14-23]|uniref:type IX secretion system protein PorD n=1 Tax=Aquimarina mycalae TaxID=3040073 RepID=UPI002477E11A|nr:DUF4835 family protein [Aquimarina sp. 2201CG14-23]MDH7448270.1 DUF4835 family protein [Aquimarina sp. 2201CG14-23]